MVAHPNIADTLIWRVMGIGHVAIEGHGEKGYVHRGVKEMIYHRLLSKQMESFSFGK